MKFIGDISKKTWAIEEEQHSSIKHVFFNFVDNDNDQVFFNNLSFGIAISKDKTTILEDSFPKKGISYIFNDQEYIDFFDASELLIGTEYDALIWAENNGIRWESNFSFILPLPPQPYPSWSYDNESEEWAAPVDMPDDEFVYYWSEEDQKWIAITDE